MAGFVSMATSLQVATRPAAVTTGLVATAFTAGQLIFIVTRFGNMFYLPLLGNFVDQAARDGAIDILIDQMRWIVVAAALGATVALFLLPSFVELSCRVVRSIHHHKSLLKALFRLKNPSHWRGVFGSARRPGLMGVKPWSLSGIPKVFLLLNIVASSIWTVGALAAVTVSGLHPEFEQTALLLSGLVNSFAAIAFSVWVDPQAAMITDQAKGGTRPKGQVTIVAILLICGNIVGAILGLFIFKPAVDAIAWATLNIGAFAHHLDSTIIWLILGNAFILLLNGTVYSSRISAVRTAKVAMSIAIFNFFSLIARLSGQVYAPFVGAMTDQFKARGPEAATEMAWAYRGLLAGATLGCLLGLLLLPTFVRIYQRMIVGLDHRGSLEKVLLAGLHPKRWRAHLGCFAKPWSLHVNRAALKRLPKAFLWANVIVFAFQTVGQLAAIYAGAAMSPEVARTTTLLSPLINGVATMTLAILVDPSSATIVDEAIEGKRPQEDVETMTFWLALGTVAGTIASQILFLPAAWLISRGALLLDFLL